MKKKTMIHENGGYANLVVGSKQRMESATLRDLDREKTIPLLQIYKDIHDWKN